MLGLGLGLSKGTNLLSNLKLLTRNSDWAIWGDKATGTSKGINSPATNPIQDLVGNADGTLQGFGFTSGSGYVDIPIKGVGDEISYSNLVTNGDFANGTTGWIGAAVTLEQSGGIEDSKYVSTINEYGGVRQNSIIVPSGKRIYFSMFSKIFGTRVSQNALVEIKNSANTNVASSIIPLIGAGNAWKKFNAIYAPSGESTYMIISLYNLAGLKTGIDNIQIINLSDNPQVQALESKLGRQLTVAECDYLFDFTAITNTIKAKVVTGVIGDGADDVILFPSNAPNPVGTQDFGFAFVFKTGAILNTTGYIKCRNLDTGSNVQYGFLLTNNLFSILLNSGAISIGTLLTNTFYKLTVKRKSGVLLIKLNNLEVYNTANAINLTSQPNSRIFGRSASSDGSTHSTFSNVLLLYDNYNNGTDIDAWEVDQNKAIAKIYGL